jgi:ATP-dependent Clp protease ATP-binding subunit ClpC
MPKINVYLPDDLAEAVRDAQVPVSAICQTALQRAVRDVAALRGTTATEAHPPPYAPFTAYTPRARKVVELAEEAARERGHAAIGTEHVLLGILDERTNLAVRVLAALDVEPDDVRRELVGLLPPPDRDAAGDGRLPITPSAKHTLELALREALGLGHNYVGCEHLLLGLVAADEGLAADVLRRMGMEVRTTRRAVVAALAGYVHDRASANARPAAASAAGTVGTASLDEIVRRLDAIEARLAG